MGRKETVWIKGTDLNPQQKLAVMVAFPWRWTYDNCQREKAWERIKGSKPTAPLISDREWLERYKFPFKSANGATLATRPAYAKPLLSPPPEPALQSTKAMEYTLLCLAEV